MALSPLGKIGEFFWVSLKLRICSATQRPSLRP
jgi:hypothetical protein